MMKIAIINGPNLNLTGLREPDIYGQKSFDQYIPWLFAQFPDHDIIYFQSNVEGELINMLHSCGGEQRAILLNAGGYAHTSVALHDAIKAIGMPVIEIHLSNIAAREEFRHTSMIGRTCIGTIAGFGLDSYRLGILALENLA
ncbi:MAG: 3-dehydroquinate dehydratase [Bacteroidetes bacterium]|uniref:3-dehydroquinate dehydratase n=1 Tax=Candidatus Pullibacteroides excrementavium TaxID=2840905 RepID=A0A9D9DRL8_9BACT|nr:3-dehydroquinate dehydratase [Candidatus Pullibacteroides excrementavium]